MKLNCKGISIVELIVSVSLISVVMLFLYRLLADVTFQKDNDYFASVNQEQRIEIVDKLSNLKTKDSSDYKLKNIEVQDNTILFYNEIYEIMHEVAIEKENNKYSKIAIYDANNTVVDAWIIKGGTLNSKPYCETKRLDSYYLTECTIEVYTNNTENIVINDNGILVDNNNTIDDIVFSIMYIQPES